jgi:hypothetical protein
MNLGHTLKFTTSNPLNSDLNLEEIIADNNS